MIFNINFQKYPRMIVTHGYFFCFANVLSQVETQNDVISNSNEILNRSSIAVNLQTFFSKPHICVDFGKYENKKSLYKMSYSGGLGYYSSFRNLNGLSMNMNYGILSSYSSFSNVYPDSILPMNYREDFIWTYQDILQLTVNYRKYKIFKNYNFLLVEIGLNQQLILFKNDFVDGSEPTTDYIYYPLTHLRLNNRRIVTPPSFNGCIGIGHINRDTDLLSLSLVANLSFFNLYESTVTSFPKTPFESQLKIQHKGSFIGLKLVYSSTLKKKKK